MRKLLSALQFLTIIPVRIKKVSDKDIAGSIAWFPAIGLVLGLILAAAANLGRHTGFPDLAMSAILIMLLTVITGGIHLDGLADLSDALGSGKGKDEMLAIMRDSRIGSMGAIAIAGCLILKIAFLFSIPANNQFKSIILMCVVSRWAMVLSMYASPYARKEGKAKSFIAGINSIILGAATLSAIIFCFMSYQITGLIVIGITGALVYAAGKYLTKKLGGITGDTIGAVCEISEIVSLFILCL